MLIFIFCCLSYFAFSQNKTDAKTISELEFDMQKIIENGLNLDQITRKNKQDHIDYFLLGVKLSYKYKSLEKYEKRLELSYHLLDLKIIKEFTYIEVLALCNLADNNKMPFLEAEDIFLKAIELAKKCVKTGMREDEHEMDEREMCAYFLDIALNNISIFYSGYGLKEKALEYILMCDTVNYPQWTTFSTIALRLGDLDDHRNRHKYSLRSLKALNEVANPKLISALKLIQFYNNISISFAFVDDPVNALIYNKKAIKLCQKEYGLNHSAYASCLETKFYIMVRNETDFDFVEKFSEVSDMFIEMIDIYNASANERLYLKALADYIALQLNFDINFSKSDDSDTRLQSILALIKDFFGVYSEVYLELLNSAKYHYEFNKDDFVNARICLDKEITGLSFNYQIYEKQFNEKLRKKSLEHMLGVCNDLLYYERSIDSTYEESISHFNLWSYLKGRELNSKKALSYAVYNSKDKKIINKYDAWCRINKNISVSFEKDKYERALLGWNIEELQNDADNIERYLLKTLSLNFTKLDDDFFSNITLALKYNEAYIDVIQAPFGYYAYVIKKGDESPHLIYLGNVAYVDSIYNYYSNYTNKRPSTYEFSDGDEVYGNICYENFWGKFEPCLEGVSNVYFSPDGVYSKINPNVLYDSISSSFIIDKYDIVYVSNVEDFINQKENIQLYERPDDLHAVLVGNPTFLLGEDEVVFASNEKQSRAINQDELDSLQRGASLSQLPATQTEVDLISDNLKSKGWDVELISGVDATETRVKSIEAPKILHIATHGFFFEDKEMVKRTNMISKDNKKAVANPMTRSGLIFSGAENTMNGEILADDNGWLNSYEASLLNLRGTELVVLSACETGSGDVQNGKGVYGLQRAIRVAGAESLIMSMWEVDDKATQELMTYFYDYWIDKNMTKKEAFKGAQQKIREKYKHPYYWGAFIMLGE